MNRLLHIGLLLLAVLGLMGQSTAMAKAMAPARGAAVSPLGAFQISMAGMDCMDMVKAPASGKAPCKKMTLQCMAAMGCAPLTLIQPDVANMPSPFVDRAQSTMSLAARLWGRTYGPEPDPPSFLI